LAYAEWLFIQDVFEGCEGKYCVISTKANSEYRSEAIAYAEILDQFNNGLLGPAHCDDWTEPQDITITEVNLLATPPGGVSGALAGNLASGWQMPLSGVPGGGFYTLDVANLTTTPAALPDGMYAFYLNPASITDPISFYDYWKTQKGIDSSDFGKTNWEGVAYDIISGFKPIFFLKVEALGADPVMLIDGLLYQAAEICGGCQTYLRIDSDYPVGLYEFITADVLTASPIRINISHPTP
jgi:hypothetical protein